MILPFTSISAFAPIASKVSPPPHRRRVSLCLHLSFLLSLHTVPTSSSLPGTRDLAHLRVLLCDAGSRHLRRHCRACVSHNGEPYECHQYVARRDIVTLQTPWSTNFRHQITNYCIYTFLVLQLMTIFFFIINELICFYFQTIDILVWKKLQKLSKMSDISSLSIVKLLVFWTQQIFDIFA